MQNDTLKDYSPENILDVLRDRNPVYKIKWNMQYSKELAKELKDSGLGELQEYSLDFNGYNSAASFDRDFQKLVENLIFDYKKKKSQKELNSDYFQAILDEINTADSSFTKLNSRDKEFYFQPDASIYISEGPGNYTDYTIETIEDKYFKEIAEISDTKYNLIQKLKAALEELVVSEENTASNPESIKKLSLKLSVPEIALLFRLLDDEKLISYKHKTEIYRHIATTLQTEKQDNISESSIKNKFLSTDNTALKNLDAILANLRHHLKKIQ